MKTLLRLLVVLLPWRAKRLLLVRFWGYRLHPSARIGLSWFFPKNLEMAEGAAVGHFTVAIHLDNVVMGARATIGRGNWITGFPKGHPRHFAHQPDRDPSLYLGPHSAITKNHHIDCTSCIRIGAFVTVAGYRSQFLTHSINIDECRQDCAPIIIGDYAFVGTNVVILGGAVLPARSVLGAKALLNKAWTEEYRLYAGVPAKPVAELSPDARYFQRVVGRVD
jgi:acetyltransferase-like isoleucine patch superfamily enzyme